jgi:hypothetical protein
MLLSELQNDPANLGYAAHVAAREDQTLADLINAPNYTTVRGKIPSAQLLIWACKTGMRAAIEDTATTVGHPLRSSALGLRDVMQDVNAFLDLGDNELCTSVSYWVQSTLLTQAHADSLVALSERQVSRSEYLGISASREDISRVLNNA